MLSYKPKTNENLIKSDLHRVTRWPRVGQPMMKLWFTYPAHGAEALVDPLVPATGSRVLVFGRQSLGTSVEVCHQHRDGTKELVPSLTKTDIHSVQIPPTVKD